MNDLLNPKTQIENLANEKLEVFKASIRPDGTYKSRIYRGLQNTSQQIESDYGSRFLIELTQNGYDAHPRETTNGKIKVLLNLKEGTYGVLYVANGGTGFSWSNVESLCDIGNSDKPVGESIGNKGLGFRSVSYITDDPQIYSMIDDTTGDYFNGYCFRFAHEEDFDSLIPDEIYREKAKKDIPRFHIPIALTSQLESISQFAKEGYSTVVRLPLRDESAQQAVLKEIKSLRDSKVPLILFLRRLSILEVLNPEKPDLNFSLTRFNQSINIKSTTEADDKFSRVDLGEQGAYLLVRYSIPEAQVIKAIEQSIQQHQLHSSWKDWKGDGDLAVAVRLDDGPVSPNLYTFLPMGDQADCPFYGYLHGAFFPKADRETLIAGIPLNSLYIDEAINICVRTILALRNYNIKDNQPLNQSERDKAIIDLLTWKQVPSITRAAIQAAPVLIREAFKKYGSEFADADIFPVLPRNESCWGNAHEIWRWDNHNFTIFNPQQLVKLANVAILLPQLGNSRIDRLQEFIPKCDDTLSLNPPNVELAEATEKIASKILLGKTSAKNIRNFYVEIEQIFRDKPDSLSGRRILICADRVLRPTMTSDLDVSDSDLSKRGHKRSKLKTTAIFSPSKRLGKVSRNPQDASEILYVPKELTKRFAFLTDRLDWYNDLDNVRDFLEKNRLVRRYDAEELVNQVSSLVHRKRNKRTLTAALNWVYNLWISSHRSSRPIRLKNANLLVLTLKGEWVEADQAIFSAGWSADSKGDVTEKFLSQAGIYSEDLNKLNHVLLARKSEKLFSSKHSNEWYQFLTELGVKKGLESIEVIGLDTKPRGWSFESRSVCDRFQLGDSTNQYWKTDINLRGEKTPYSSSEYEFETAFSYFPGQEQYDSFPEDIRIQFAQLLLFWLENAPESRMKATMFPNSAKWAGRFSWPSPVAAFIHQASWVPVEVPNGLDFDLQFLKPSEIWLTEDDAGHQIPYLPRIHRSLRRIVTTEIIREKFINWCGASSLNSPSSLAKQVGYLGEIYSKSVIEPYHLKSFLNLYFDTWSRLANVSSGDEKTISSYVEHLIVHQYDQNISVKIKELSSDINVRDTEDSLGLELLGKSGFYVFNPGPDNASNIAKMLKNVLGERFKAISDTKFTVLVDGVSYEVNKPDDDFAVKLCPWLPPIVYLAMESLTGTTAHHLPSDRMEVIHRLNNVRLYIGKTIEFQINGKIIGLPESSNGAVAIKEYDKPLLILQSDNGTLNWESLALASSHISQLIEQPDLGPSVLIALRALQRDNLPISGPVSTFDSWSNNICRELRLDTTHIQKALERLGQDITRVNRRLRPIIYYYCGDDALQQFTDLEQKSETLSDIISFLKSYLTNTNHTPEEIISACQRSTGFGFIRDELSLNFGRFNNSLMAVGEEADLHPESHKDAVNTFISLNKNAIMDCIRAPFIELFDKQQCLSNYIQYRSEIVGIQPKSEWLIEYETPNEPLIKTLINEWLASRGMTNIDQQPTGLPTWSEVRNKNRLGIKRFGQAHTNTIKAWCNKHSIQPPETWKALSVGESLCDLLETLGAIDFKTLDEDNILSWLIFANAWPQGMPQSIDLKKLELKESDLQEQHNRDIEAKLRREKEARLIFFNNRQVDPHEVDPSSLALEIGDTLSEEVFDLKLDQMTTLALATPPENKKPSSGGHGKGGGHRNTHPDKTDLIGFLGEAAVYHWLKKQLPKQDIESAWVSIYRKRLFPGPGDDSLGFDFKVQHRKTIYLEVKSSLTDPEEFDLGDTEVRKARDCASKREGEYRIVYVSNLFDTKLTRIEILPNPLTDVGKRFYRVGDNGIKYEFSRNTHQNTSNP